MIVVDTHVVAQLLIPGEATVTSERVLQRDPDWCAPLLWRSEMRSVLALYLRTRLLDLTTAFVVMETAEELLSGHEFSVPSARVLALVARSRSSACDCEFIALAEDLDTTLVTSDGRLAKAFPDRATYAPDFVGTAS